jgi:hypothetical protein
MKKSRPPHRHDAASQNPAVGVAWYTSSEWSRVKAAAADPERFENSFEEWLVIAEDALVQLRSTGLSAERFLVNADELAKWCGENRLENNASARARFVSEQLQARNRDGA